MPTTRKRIVYVNPCADISGAEVSLLLLLNGLEKQRFELSVIVPEEGTFAERARALGLDVLIFPMHTLMLERDIVGSLKDGLRALREIGDIEDLLSSLQPDLIHINSYRVGIPFSWAAQRLNIPTIWHIRDIPQSSVKKKLLRRISNMPDHVVAISDAVAQAIYGEDHSHVAVVHNGVDLDAFRNIERGKMRQEIGLENDTMLFCSIGQLIPWKGQDLLIEAFARVQAQLTVPVHLLIVGDLVRPVWAISESYLTYPDRLKSMVNELGLQDTVTFTGFRTDIAQVLFDSDCLVHTPTSPEPFGRVLVEAMAAGKPVIAPNAGGIPEIVENGVTGLLFEAGDIDSLTQMLLYAAENTEMLAEMGERGQERVNVHFTADHHVSAIENLYDKLLDTCEVGGRADP